MYAAYFGLTERPFSLAPDPRYLYLSDAHREALAHLLYGIGEGGSFVQLTGEVGTGKTTVCRALLEQLPPDVAADLPKELGLQIMALARPRGLLDQPIGHRRTRREAARHRHDLAHETRILEHLVDQTHLLQFRGGNLIGRQHQGERAFGADNAR